MEKLGPFLSHAVGEFEMIRFVAGHMIGGPTISPRASRYFCLEAYPRGLPLQRDLQPAIDQHSAQVRDERKNSCDSR